METMVNKSTPVVCFVANFKYLYKHFPRIYQQLRVNGNYENQILIITTLLSPTFLIKYINKKNKIKILRFKKIKFDSLTETSLNNLNVSVNRHKTKNFQWHKLYLFHPKLKKYPYIFYMDINMNIHHDINALLKELPANKLLARADGYPTYQWKLKSQFDTLHPGFGTLAEDLDLEITDYFQTGILYYDTQIVEANTLEEIMSLVKKYPFSKTNEQGILNLYFIFINKMYTELVEVIEDKISYFYWKLSDKEVIITKALTTQNK
jgi:hypothetical protein